MYWKPYVALIWLGALLMFLGGGVSLADRRLRIGVAKRAQPRVRGPAPLPAE
jgi:cytochrome c-type biogenesis protein CcmF